MMRLIGRVLGWLARWILFPALLVAVALIAVYGYFNPAPPASQAFVNGRVLTMNARRDIAEAVFVRAGRIEQVGSEEQIRALIESDTVVHDLAGRTLLPGFIDAHGHFPGSGLAAVAVNLNSPPIHDVTDIAMLLDRLRAHDAEQPGDGWLLGYGYDDTVLAELRHPNRADLDQVSSERPILVMHISGHMGVVNGAGLQRLGIHRDSPDPAGGQIRRGPGGEPDGLLLETAFEPAREQALHFSPGEQYDLVRYAVADYLAQGVTTAQNGLAESRHGRSLSLASRIGLIPLRLVLWPNLEFAAKLMRGALNAAEMETERFDIGAVKLQVDGSIQGYTGFLSKPYYQPRDSDPPDYRGAAVLKPEALRILLQGLHGAGLQLAVHANGDAAIDQVIAAFAEAQREHPVQDPRMVLVHAQMLRPDQYPQLRRLGITPSFFNSHVYYWGDRHRDIFLGPERAARISPLAGAGAAGLRYSLHMDTPVVPMQPMRMLHAAVTRETAGGRVLGEDQRIAPMDALAAMTIDAAWQIFQDDNRGSIEAGKWADLTILDGDPLGEPARLMDIRVDRTIVGGVTVYER